ncbi:MAG: class D sortase [Chloroflexi bacterium]|nr:class D sortase [Chloroflexota bacterium]
MGDSRSVDDLTLDELEAAVEQRRRVERARQFADRPSGIHFRPITIMARENPVKSRRLWPFRAMRDWKDRVLLGIELAAIIALVAIAIGSLTSLQTLNDEVVQARQTALASMPLTNQQLPGSSYPPSKASSELPGSSSPPESAPAALGVRLETVASIPVPTPGPRSPTRITIPSINVDWPVVEGDSWEELKQGIGHRVGSANPGERGNLVLSGHNDVYGEPFRDLERLEPGQEIAVYSGANAFKYIVKTKRVVDPNDLSVLSPSNSPIITLITCTPYRVDTQRLVVIGELSQ